MSNNYKQNIIFFQAFSVKETEQLLSQSYSYWFASGQITLALITKYKKKKKNPTNLNTQRQYLTHSSKLDADINGTTTNQWGENSRNTTNNKKFQASQFN